MLISANGCELCAPLKKVFKNHLLPLSLFFLPSKTSNIPDNPSTCILELRHSRYVNGIRNSLLQITKILGGGVYLQHNLVETD